MYCFTFAVSDVCFCHIHRQSYRYIMPHQKLIITAKWQMHNDLRICPNSSTKYCICKSAGDSKFQASFPLVTVHSVHSSLCTEIAKKRFLITVSPPQNRCMPSVMQFLRPPQSVINMGTEILVPHLFHKSCFLHHMHGLLVDM